MGCLGASHSRCLILSFRDSTGLAIQGGALTWLDTDAGCWREMSWGLCLEHLSAAFQEMWLWFLTAWQLVSERECLRVSFLRDPSRGFFYILRCVRSSSMALPPQTCPTDHSYSSGKELDSATHLMGGASCIYREGRNWGWSHLGTSTQFHLFFAFS